MVVAKVGRPMPPIVQRVLGYIRVSTDEQANSGAGLEAQRAAIQDEAKRRGWDLVRIHEDKISGKSINGRRGLQAAIKEIEAGEAHALVVAKLDRLSRSLIDFAGLMDRSRKKGWALVALDLGVDTSTPSGEMMANVLAVFAQFERRLIGQRTRDALAVKKSQGVLLGRRSTMDRKTITTIKRLRKSGKSLPEIAAILNKEGVPTGQALKKDGTRLERRKKDGSATGARWWPSTVKFVLDSAQTRAKEHGD